MKMQRNELADKQEEICVASKTLHGFFAAAKGLSRALWPVLVLLFLLCCAAVILSAALVDVSKDRVLTADAAASLTEPFDCILVLGCRVYPDGTLSPMLEDRVAVAVSLYRAGLSDRILMSGDGRFSSYDEVSAMRRAAIEQGVPEEAILIDPAGFSTYDSIARLLPDGKELRFLVVTQEYHLYRAVYLTEKLGIEAYGVCADLRPYSGQWRRELREVFARCKDIYCGLAMPSPSDFFKND